MMRKLAFALVLGTAAVGATSAWGQYRGYDRGWEGRMPGGDWDRTCTDARMNGPILRARCDDGNGRWVYTEVDVRRCGGAIQNSWGRLTCGGGWGSYSNGYGNGYGNRYGGAWGGATPGGSWRATCREARMSGPVLSAICEDDDGRWRSSSINVQQCYGDRVRNDYGRLVCD